MEQQPTHLIVKKEYLFSFLALLAIAFGVGFYYFQQAQNALITQQQELKNIAGAAGSSMLTAQEASDKLARVQSDLAATKNAASKPSAIIEHQNTSPGKLSNAQIINKAKPAVVYITTSAGAGSGMIISPDGYVLTNAHVVTGVNSAKITLSTGVTYFAQVVGRDEYTDIAVLKVLATGLPSVILGDSDSVGPGDSVYALGFPFGLTISGDVSFTAGVVSRRYADAGGTYIQNTAEIYHGSSGGPLVDNTGRVVGINSIGYTPSVVGSFQLGETVKFAIPINVAKSQISSLERGYSLAKPAALLPAETVPEPTKGPASTDDKTVGENYYITKHTCVGLSGAQYDYCVSYAYNH